MINIALIKKLRIKSIKNTIILIDLGIIGSDVQKVYDIFCFLLNCSQKYSQNVLLSLTIASSYSKLSKEGAR